MVEGGQRWAGNSENPLIKQDEWFLKQTVAAASLPHKYFDFSKALAEGDEDDYLRLCANNNGVPIRIGVALDSEIKKVLIRGIRRLDKPNERHASLLCIQDTIRSMPLDSGANGSLNHRDV